VAIIDAYVNPNAAADLASYRSQLGLGAATLTQLNQTGGPISTVGGNAGWGQQEMLDLEMVSAICKSCAILYVGAKSASFTDLAAAVDTAAANGAAVISDSCGGCSAYITKPSWQHDTACSRRTVADVAAVADPATGVAVYDSYGSTGGANWMVFGGTSVAAPIIGAVYALSGNTAGVPAQLAYTSAGSLFDVTSGSNGRCVRGKNTSGAYLCTGGLGYDGPTGNGTPQGTGAF